MGHQRFLRLIVSVVVVVVVVVASVFVCIVCVCVCSCSLLPSRKLMTVDTLRSS